MLSYSKNAQRSSSWGAWHCVIALFIIIPFAVFAPLRLIFTLYPQKPATSYHYQD